MAARKLRKRCEKCGWTGMVRPRERRCKQTGGGFGGFLCYGALVAAPIVHAKAATDDKLERKLQAAHVNMDNAIKAALRMTKKAAEYSRVIKRLEKRIELRDHPPAEAPKPKPRKRTRVINLPTEEPTTI